MNKQQIGQAIFAQIKQHITANGGSMAKGKFPADFPISRASCYNIRNGRWTIGLLQKLPFKTVQIEFHNQTQKK